MKLNAGCGQDIKEGYINLDRWKHDGVDIVHDLLESLPFPENSFDEIYCSHVLEHFFRDDIYFIMNEFARTLKSSGVLIIKVPYRLHSYWSFQHLTHFIMQTFDNFTKDLKSSNSKGKWKYKLRILRNRNFPFLSPIINLMPYWLYEWCKLWIILPADEIEVHFEKNIADT